MKCAHHYCRCSWAAELAAMGQLLQAVAVHDQLVTCRLMDKALMDVLAAVDEGRVGLRWISRERCEAQTADGWRLRFFDDTGDLDYLDAFAPPGEEWQDAPHHVVMNWGPQHPERWGWAPDGISPTGYRTETDTERRARYLRVRIEGAGPALPAPPAAPDTPAAPDS